MRLKNMVKLVMFTFPGTDLPKKVEALPSYVILTKETPKMPWIPWMDKSWMGEK